MQNGQIVSKLQMKQRMQAVSLIFFKQSKGAKLTSYRAGGLWVFFLLDA